MKPYQALIWNEWRQMRGNIAGLTGVTVLLWLLLLGCSFNKALIEYIEIIATALAIGLPLLYSAMLADSFAREFSQKTDSFLLEMPATPTKIFFCKYLTNLFAFLILVILEALMMIRLTRLTSGKHFTDEFSLGDWIIALGIIASIWILAHAMVFFTSLLCKKPGNSIVGIIIMPLLYVLILPGTMAITMFFIKDDNIWVLSSTLLTFILLYCSCMGFGWYLWTRRISCGKRILKAAIAGFFIILIAPWILYSMAYLIVSVELKLEIKKAENQNLILDIQKKLPHAVPKDQNAISEIVNFANSYSALIDSSKANSALNWTAYWNETEFSKKNDDKDSSKATLDTALYLLQSPEINKCYSILANAFKKPAIQSGFKYRENNDKYYSNLNAVRTAGIFLYNKANALRLMQRDEEMFKCLKDIDKITHELAKEPLENSHFYELMLRRLKYEATIAAGPDNLSSIKYYNEMIKEIDSINFIVPDDTYIIFEVLANQNLDIKSSPSLVDQFVESCRRLYPPRQTQATVAWFQWHIQHQKLLKLAAGGKTFLEIADDFDTMLRKGDIPLIYKNTFEKIQTYFGYKTKFEAYKLCLALKIYKAKHGKFPDSLQQLVPEILPEVPVYPKTGKDYIYQVEADGFHLFSNSTDSNYPSSNIKYQTWKIATEKAK